MSMSKRASLRATPSALATKTGPSVPPADTVYTPLIKAVLSQRLRRVFYYSIALSWISASFWTARCLGGLEYLGLFGWIENTMSLSNIAVAVFAFVVGPLPVITLRKQYLSSVSLVAPSPSATLKAALSKPGVLRILLVYLASAVASAVLHVIMTYSLQLKRHSDPKLTVFTTSRKHPYRLNGRFLFFILSQVVLATSYFVRTVVADRYCMKWPRNSSALNSSRPVGPVLAFASGIALLCLTVASAIPAFALFAAFRTVLHIFSSLPIIRPLAGHFSRGSYTPMLVFYHGGLIWRSLLVGFTTISGWELAEHVLGFYLEQPIVVAHATPKPAETLTSALMPAAGPAFSSLYFAHHALAELSNLTQTSAPIRASIYGDVAPGMQGNVGVWSVLMRESLVLLGKDYQTFLRRGAPEPKPVAPADPTPPVTTVPSAKPLDVLKSDIYKPTPPSPVRILVDALASDGTFAKAVDSTTPNVDLPELFKSVLPMPHKQLVDLKKSISSLPAPPSPSALANTFQEQGVNVVRQNTPKWGRSLAEDLHAWWTTPRVKRSAEAALPNRETDVFIIQVLANLVNASLEEDTYGVVQRDIPRVLEAFLSFLTAIEEYEAELRAMLPPQPSEESLADKLKLKEMAENALKAQDIGEACEVLDIVGVALKEGISRIVRTFGEKLSAFKFPPRTAQKLQAFV